MSDRVVTELIVDSRGAQQGTAEYAASLRVAQNAVDRFTASQEKQATASKAAGTAAADGGERIQQSAQAYTAAERAANNYLARLDPVFFATQRLGKESSNVEVAMRGLDQQLLRGAINVDQYNQRQALLTGRLGEVKAAAAALATGTVSVNQALGKFADGATQAGGTTNRLSFAMRDLGLQSIDVFQGLATGAPVFRTLIQQGAQVVQVNAAMGVGFKDMAAAIGGALLSGLRAIISPIGIAATALVAFGAAAFVAVGRFNDLEAVNRSLAVSIAAVGNASNVSVRQLQGYITQLKQAGIDPADAQKTADILARNTQLTTAQRDRAASLAPDLATALGTDTASAAKLLTDAMLGQVDAVKKLDDGLNILSPSLKATAENARSATGTLRDTGPVIDALAARITGLREQSLGPTDLLFQQLKNSWNGFIDAIAKSDFVKGLVQGWTDIFKGLAGAMQGVTIGSLNEERAQLERQARDIQSGNTGSSIFMEKLGFGGPRLEEIDAKILGIKQRIEQIREAEQRTTSLSSGPGQTTAGPSATDVEIKKLDELARAKAATGPSATIRDLTKENAEFEARLKSIGARTAENAALFDNYTNAIAANKKQIDDAGKSVQGHIDSNDKLTIKLHEQIAAQRALADAYAQGPAAVAEVTARLQAQEALLSAGVNPALAKNKQRVDELTQAYKDLALGTAEANLAKQTTANEDQLKFLQSETTSLGQNNNARMEMLDHLKAEQELKRQGIDVEGAIGQKYLASVDAISQATRAFDAQKSALDGLASAFSQSFDQISQAVTNAMFQSGTAVVNWGNTFKAVLQQGVSQLIKFAALNPLLNTITGQNNPTLSSILGAIGGSTASASPLVSFGGGSVSAAADDSFFPPGSPYNIGGGTSGAALSTAAALAAANGSSSGGGFGGLLNTGSSLFSIGRALFPSLGNSSGGSLFSGLGESLGLTGQNGLLSSVTSLLNTPLWSSSIAGTGGLTGSTLGADASSFGILPAGAGFTSIGQLIGGAGLGFGAGSLLGGLVQSGLGKVGPAPTIGAGVGAIGGAVAGSLIFPGPGTLIGGLLGGLLGGGGGGLIGPQAASPYSSTYVGVSNSGLLNVGDTRSQLVDAGTERSAALADSAKVNDLLEKIGVRIGSIVGIDLPGKNLSTQPGDLNAFQIGQNSPKGDIDPSKFQDIASSFPYLRFNAPGNDALSQNINWRGFANPEELQGVVTSIGDFIGALKGTDFEGATQDLLNRTVNATVPNSEVQSRLQDVATFYTQTVPGLLNQTQGSYAAQLKQTADTYNVAIAKAQQLGHAEAELTDARDKALNKVTADVLDQQQQANAALVIRRDTANAAVSGNPADAQSVALASFDLSAQQQIKQRGDALVGIYGDAYRDTEQFAYQMKFLEDALAAERLAIVKQGNDAIVAQEQARTKITTDLTARQLSAQASISGSPADAATASLYAFDANATQQRDAFRQQVIAANDNIDTRLAEYDRTVALERQSLTYQQAVSGAQAQLTAGNILGGNQVSYAQARGQATGNPADQKAAALVAFDLSAFQARGQLYQQLTALFGTAYAATADYAKQMTALERTQGEQRVAVAKQYDDAAAAAQLTAGNILAGNQVAYAQAHGQVTGNPADQKSAALVAFDLSAHQAKDQLYQQLTSLFGTAYAATADYANQVTTLEKAQYEQRVVLAQQYDDAITAAASAPIQSLADYARGLSFSQASPLSPQAQLSAAQSQFTAVATSAGLGNIQSIAQLQNSADTYIAAARNVFGSGTGFVDAFSKVVDALNKVSQVAPNTLTASVLISETRSQTQQLLDGIKSLQDEVGRLRSEVASGSNAPARMAA